MGNANYEAYLGLDVGKLRRVMHTKNFKPQITYSFYPRLISFKGPRGGLKARAFGLTPYLLSNLE